MRTMFWTLAVFVGFAISTNVDAADRKPYLKTTRAGPFELCVALDKQLPRQIDELRKLGILERETVRPDLDYCTNDQKQCRIHELTFRGLNIELLVDVKSQKASVLVATFSRSNWNLLNPFRVGQLLSRFESHYGVNIQRDDSSIGLLGECSSVDLKHKGGRVSEIFLDCQACI